MALSLAKFKPSLVPFKVIVGVASCVFSTSCDELSSGTDSSSEDWIFSLEVSSLSDVSSEVVSSLDTSSLSDWISSLDISSLIDVSSEVVSSLDTSSLADWISSLDVSSLSDASSEGASSLSTTSSEELTSFEFSLLSINIIYNSIVWYLKLIV